MPFGLCNAPLTFQATMNEHLKPFLHKFIMIFFDNILMYKPTLEEHLQHLTSVFDSLTTGQFYLNESKCLLA